jgi:hypothetical protein
MTPVEIFALIIALAVIIKLVVLLVKPQSWRSVVKVVYGKPGITMIIGLVLAVVVLYYLLMELTIVQIFASMLFLALIAGVTMSAYYEQISELIDNMLKDKAIVKKAWLSIIIWLILSVWVLYVLFS